MTLTTLWVIVRKLVGILLSIVKCVMLLQVTVYNCNHEHMQYMALVRTELKTLEGELEGYL